MASYYDDTSYKKEPIFPINRIGTTVLLNGQNGDPVQALKAEIFAGAGNVEICAPGTGASNQGMQFTFEGIEADQRQAMRELAKINNVQITTHSSFRVGNLAGLGEGGYKEQNRKMSVDEVKKAIDFAADATMGGSVVVHTGELPRPLAGDRLINKGGAKFSSHNKEADEAVYHLIDPESGKVISSVHADGIIYEPVADSKNPYLLDSDGKKPLVNPVIKQLIMERIQADPSSKYRNKKFDDLPLDMKESAYVKNLVVDPETKTIRTNSITFDEFAKKLRQTKADITNEQVAKEFFKRQSDAELQQALGQSMEYEKNYLDTREKREKKLQELQKFKELQDNPLAIRDQEVKQINSQISMFKQALPRVEDPEQKKEVEEEIQRLQMQSDNLKTMSESELKRNAAESLKKKRQEIDETERTMQYHQEVAVGGKLKAREVLKKIDNARDIQDYALEQSAKSISELGIYAMQQTERARAERKGDKIQPIMITLENIFPETYGAHPQELKNIILKGRKQMVADLMDKKIMGSHAFEKKEEAEAKAKEHIKATIDTGHLNIWRKNFIANPGETKEDTDKRFKEWAKGQLKSFVEDKADLVGNVHIADNLGYDDSHVTPGLGTAPVKEFLQMLKDKNYKHVVTSEGGFARGKSGQAGMRGVWAVAGNSLYSSGKSDVWTNPTRDNFYSSTDMYHTSIQKPNFMFRGYAPDNDDWKPWSGTGLE